MFCPKCGGEYRSGFTECADCLIPLVFEPVEVSPASGDPTVDLVTVFRSGNPALVPLAKSLLESAEIDFVTKGENVQDLIGWGRFPAGLNLVVGPVEFLVNADDAEEANRLLEDLHESSPLPDETGGDNDDDGSQPA
jgi:putative signal transducing protein